MRIPSLAFILTITLPGGAVFAQAANPVNTGAQSAQPQATAPATASDLLLPALNQAQTTLKSLNLDKWKRGSVREEATANVSSLLHDLDNNMQPLITAADAAPGQLSKAIPLIKHLDAFYDVLLRVEEGARVSAPPDQIDALQQALLRVSQARIAYDDVLQTQAAGQEKQVVDLQTAVRAEQESAKEAERKAAATSASATAPCKPATPTHRRRRTTPSKKTTAPPAQGTTPKSQ